MVNKLFVKDPYATQCKAKIVKKDGVKIWLDQTVFFAFAGGQVSDKGTIAGIQVKEAVASKEGEFAGDIYYVLEDTTGLKEGDEVEVKIDADFRTKVRRLHSAAHLVSYAFEQLQGEKEFIGSNVTETKSRLDWALDTPITPLLDDAQALVNKWIDEDKEVKRTQDPQDPNKWLWIWNNKTMPCGGTHCLKTGEIGHVKLKRKNIGKGKERVEITLEGAS